MEQVQEEKPGSNGGVDVEAARAKFLAAIQAAHDELVAIKMDWITLGPWSMSKLKVLDKCPFQFYLKYILKIKVPDVIAEKDDPLSANVGSAAHRILELTLLGKSVDDSFTATLKEFVPAMLTQEQWEEKVVPLEYNITSFKERIEALARNHPIKRVLTELRMGVTKDWEPTGFFAENVWYRGVIDLIIMLANGDVIIIDHKTGGGEGSVKVYKPQLDSYKVLFHHGINKIEGAQSGIHFIAAGEVKMADYSDKAEIEGKLRRSMEWNTQAAIDKTVEFGYFKHIRGSWCKWCDYDRQGCKSAELKPLELSTKKFFPIKAVK